MEAKSPPRTPAGVELATLFSDLVRSGLCRRALNPDDARSSILMLTSAGRRRLAAARRSFDDELQVWLGAALAPERLDALASAVRGVRRHIAEQGGAS